MSEQINVESIMKEIKKEINDPSLTQQKNDAMNADNLKYTVDKTKGSTNP